MITTSLIYDRRKKAADARDKKGMVEIRIILNRKSYYISTGVRVLKNKWKNGYIVNCAEAADLNERLASLVHRTNRIVNGYIENGTALNMADVKSQVFRAIEESKNNRNDFLEWFGSEAATLQLAPGTLKHYKTVETRLTEYGMMTGWGDLTAENLYKWDAWLHRLPGFPGKSERITDAGVFKYHKVLKAMLNRAERFGKIARNPYALVRFKRGEHERVDYLTAEEMDAVRALDLHTSSELSKARDLFVFQMFTGLSYGDTQVFDIGAYRCIDGRWVNVGERVKTGTAYISELLPPVVDVLERYGWKVPRISNQDYNRSLKAIGGMAGITMPLHSHVARHTFATWMLSKGAKIENVSRMLGHTNITQTQRYAKVLAKSVHDEFEKVRPFTENIPAGNAGAVPAPNN